MLITRDFLVDRVHIFKFVVSWEKRYFLLKFTEPLNFNIKV